MLNKHSGFTLIELVISMAIGFLILAGLLQFSLFVMAQSYKQYDRLQLQYEMSTAITMIKHDLRRAGYWHWSPESGLSVFDNPFMTTEFKPASSRANISEAENSCITFSYDLDQDGLVSQNKMELFGYRQHNKALEMRSNSAFPSCDQGTWQDITSPNIVINTLTFEISNSQRDLLDVSTGCTASQPCINTLLVTITLAGYVRNKPTIQQSITGQVAIRNPILFYG